jgi:uncharacterized HAD superfamily protein
MLYCGILNVHVKGKAHITVYVVFSLNIKRWTTFICSVIRGVKCDRETTRELSYEKYYFEVSISERKFCKSLLCRLTELVQERKTLHHEKYTVRTYT